MKIGPRCNNSVAATTTEDALELLAEFDIEATDRVDWLPQLALRSVCARHEDQVDRLVEKLQKILEGYAQERPATVLAVNPTALRAEVVTKPALITNPLPPRSSAADVPQPTHVQQPRRTKVVPTEESLRASINYPALPITEPVSHLYDIRFQTKYRHIASFSFSTHN